MKINTRILVLSALVAVLLAASHAHAATFTWNGTSGATWDTTDTNWLPVSGATPWDSTNGTGNTANFTATSGNATVSSTVYANQITYTAGSGAFAINNGTINLAGTTPTISVNASRTLTIGSVLAGTSSLTKSGSGTLTLSGNNTYTGTTTVSSGTLATSAAARISDSSALTVASGATFQLGGSETVASIAGAGNYSLSSYTLTSGAATNASTAVSGNISGTGKLEKRGTGTLTLSGSNSFAGDLQAWGGNVSLGSIGNFGGTSNAGAGNISLGASTTASGIIYTGTGETSNKTIDLFGRGTLTLTANNTSGLLKFTSNLTASALASRTLAIRGTGAGELAGSIVDAASGSTALNTQANSGTNQLTLASISGVSVGAAVSGTGIAANTTILSIASNVVTLSNNTTSTILSGSNVTIAGVVNPTTVTKADAGTWTLSGSNSYSGNTTVSVGTLLVNNTSGSGTGTGTVSVSSGATLGGTGTISGATTINGTHSPGNSPGLQTFGSSLTYNAGATVVWELAGNSTGGRGSTFDGINVGTGLTFSGATALTLTFNGIGSTVNWSNSLWNADKFNTNGWLIYSGATSLTGFGNLTITTANWADAGGALFNTARPGATFSTYQSGNDIYLNYAIPEPQVWALLAFSLTTVMVLRRRRE